MSSVIKASYYVKTWDTDRQEFTPQQGVPVGPYTQFGLRRVLRKLRSIGYDVSPRECACSVLVSRDPKET